MTRYLSKSHNVCNSDKRPSKELARATVFACLHLIMKIIAYQHSSRLSQKNIISSVGNKWLNVSYWQEKLTSEGSHSSEMCPATLHCLTFFLCLITGKEHSGSTNWGCKQKTKKGSRNYKTIIRILFSCQKGKTFTMAILKTTKIQRTKTSTSLRLSFYKIIYWLRINNWTGFIGD